MPRDVGTSPVSSLILYYIIDYAMTDNPYHTCTHELEGNKNSRFIIIKEVNMCSHLRSPSYLFLFRVFLSIILDKESKQSQTFHFQATIS